MTFTYSETSLSTDLAKVRLAIGDTVSGAGVKPAGGNFSDEELAIFITGATTWRTAVPGVLRTLANQYAAAAKITQVPDEREDLTRTAAELRAQAQEWADGLTAAGTESLPGSVTVGTIDYTGFTYEVSSTGAVV